MDIQTILILVILGLAAGILSGLVGVGGGIIIVPALIFFLGFTQYEAQGTSLGLLLLPAGIFAVINYYKHGDIDLWVVIFLAIGFIAGGYFGSKFALLLPQQTLKKIFAAFIILVGVRMLFYDSAKADNKNDFKTDSKVKIIK